jgi:hypothetical protein
MNDTDVRHVGVISIWHIIVKDATKKYRKTDMRITTNFANGAKTTSKTAKETG